MHTTTSRQAKRTPKAAPPGLPYPDLEKNEGKLFWLAAYFIDLSKAEAICKVEAEMRSRGRGCLTSIALCSAETTLRLEARQSLREAVKAGTLLFAHQGTTVFNAPGALQ